MDVKLRTHDEDDLQIYGSGSPRAATRHWRLIEESEVDETAPGADFDSNELLDGGSTCAHCGVVIRSGEFVRRTGSGEFRHEVCPDND